MHELKKESSFLRTPDFTHLNKEQKRAVTFPDTSPLLVLAGPGSGKTYTLIKRIHFLLSVKHIPSGRILAITFTKSAANELQKRFQKELQGEQAPYFATFHSFFYHVLTISGIIRPNRFLTYKEKKNLLQKTYQLLGIGVTLSQSDCKKLFSAISLYKNTLQMDDFIRLLPEEAMPYGERILSQYESLRTEAMQYDFDDLPYLCLTAFQKDKKLRLKWSMAFDAILVDEFQDINPVQYELIRQMYHENQLLFAVGDDDQSIYGFRGSDPSCMRRFREEFGAEAILLTKNYRSRQAIVRNASRMIMQNPNRFPKEYQSASEEQGIFRMQCFQSKKEEYSYMEQLIAQKPEGKMLCFLFRTNQNLMKMAYYFQNAGIGFTIKEKMQNEEESFLVKDLLDYRKAAHKDASAFCRILNKPNRHISRELLSRCEYDPQKLERSAAADAVNLLERQLHALSKLNGMAELLFILKVCGYESYLQERFASDPAKREESLELLELIREGLSAGKELEEFEHVRLMSNANKENREILLMTVHGAKGLEFDSVCIADCNSGIFPHGGDYNPDFTQKDFEEERRIFYVAMTRAKESLYLLYLKQGEDNSRRKSPFLEGLEE